MQFHLSRSVSRYFNFDLFHSMSLQTRMSLIISEVTFCLKSGSESTRPSTNVTFVRKSNKLGIGAGYCISSSRYPIGPFFNSKKAEARQFDTLSPRPFFQKCLPKRKTVALLFVTFNIIIC